MESDTDTQPLDSELATLDAEFSNDVVPPSVTSVFERLNPITVGLPQRILFFNGGFRMFRVRCPPSKPVSISEVREPPVGKPGIDKPDIGRLNDVGQSVLYLADSPYTAFSEVRSGGEYCCLSEWGIDSPRLFMANGGLSPSLFDQLDHELQWSWLQQEIPFSPREERVFAFIRKVFGAEFADKDPRYRWAIACGMTCGFAHIQERQLVEHGLGNTYWRGAFPFGALLYPSIRRDKLSLNCALNDDGRDYVSLRNVHWLRRFPDGTFSGIDFATSFDSDGGINWRGSPAEIILGIDTESDDFITATGGRLQMLEPEGAILPYFR